MIVDLVKKRIINSLFTVFAVSFTGILILSLLPGTPEEAKIGERAHPFQGESPSFISKYWNFLRNFPERALGNSLVSGRRVIDEVLDAFPYSFLLALFSVLLSLAISIPIGIFTALNKEKTVDSLILAISVFFNSLPVISLGPLLAVIFSVRLGILPVSGMDGFKSIILPSLTLSIPFSAYLIRIIRKSLLEELKKGYILSIRARGVRNIRIVIFHALRNSIFSIITVVNLRIGNLITGAILTESMFSFPGVGRLLVRSVAGRDYNLAFGIMILSSLIYVFLTLITDISYAILDPRIRYACKE